MKLHILTAKFFYIFLFLYTSSFVFSMEISSSISDKEEISSSNTLSLSNIDTRALNYLEHPNHLLRDIKLDLKKAEVLKKQNDQVTTTCHLAMFYFTNFKALADIYKPKENDNSLSYHQRLHSASTKKQLRKLLQKSPKIKDVTLFKLPQLEEIYNSDKNVEFFLETSTKMPFQLLVQAYILAKDYREEASFFTTAFQPGCIAKKSNGLSKWITLQTRKHNQEH